MPKKTKAKERDIRLQLSDFIYKEYNVSFLPKHFFINLDKVYKGTYKNLTKPVSVEDLFDMWQQKMNYLNKVAEQNRQKGKNIIMTPGTHIEYETSKKSITFGDEDLTINLKNREMDETVTIDICSDKQGFLVIGAETGYKYVAQVEIPPREYTETAADQDGSLVPVPFDINKCTIYLWGMEA